MHRHSLLVALLLLVGCGRVGGSGANVSPATSPASPSSAVISPSPSPSPTAICMNSNPPPARSFGAFGYMPSLHKAVLFGGDDASNNPLNDTWVRQTGCWTQVHPAQSPPANTIVASAIDATTGVFVVVV